MTYKVREPVEIEGWKKDDGTPVMVKRYYVTSGGEPRDDNPYVSVWTDGSITAVRGKNKLFLYDDEWLGVIKAVERAMEDKKEKRDRDGIKWVAENGDRTEFFGCSVDYSINDAKHLLSQAEIRVADRVEVLIDGKWLHLCRTDLKDDVCTWDYGDARRHLADVKAKYIQGVGYGARVDDKRFAVVDAYSDG